MEIKKTLLASLLIIGIGVLLVVISIILQVASLLITGPRGEILSLATTIYTYLVVPLFIILYFWAGMRAVKKYKLDAVGGATVAAFSYFVTGLINLILTMLLSLLIVGKVLNVTGFRSLESVLAASLLGDLAGAVGMAASAACGIGLLVIGTLINFVIGGLGGLFAQR